MSSKEDYTKLTSGDGYDFFVDREIIPKTFPLTLPYEMSIVEKIIEYLHYKHINTISDGCKLDGFVLDPQLAL
jgi:hypothetical protein